MNIKLRLKTQKRKVNQQSSGSNIRKPAQGRPHVMTLRSLGLLEILSDRI